MIETHINAKWVEHPHAYSCKMGESVNWMLYHLAWKVHILNIFVCVIVIVIVACMNFLSQVINHSDKHAPIPP